MLSQCETHRNGEHSVVLGILLIECSLEYQFIWGGSSVTLQTSAEQTEALAFFSKFCSFMLKMYLLIFEQGMNRGGGGC